MPLKFKIPLTPSIALFSLQKMKHLKIWVIIFQCICYVLPQSFITNDAGKMHIFEQKYEFQYILDLNEYLYASHLLEECIEDLKLICTLSDSNSFGNFIKNVRGIKIDFDLDISKFQPKNRKRRFLPILLFGFSLMTLFAGIAASQRILEQVRVEMKASFEIAKKTLNETDSILNSMERLTNETNLAISILKENLHNLTRRVHFDRSFNDLINNVFFLIYKHNRYQAQLNIIFANGLRNHLFEVIDYGNLSESIDLTNQNLLADSHLFIPQIKLANGLDSIYAFSQMNETHLVVSVQLPMLNKKEFCLREFIPIPFYDGGIFLKLNETRSLFYINGSKTYGFVTGNEMFCSKYGDQVGCNSFFEDNLSETSTCVSKLLLNDSDKYCNFVPAVEKNYFIKLSDILIYAVVTKPIRVLLQCSYGGSILNLIEDQYITLGKAVRYSNIRTYI